jgi:hypothetical protein
MTLEDQAFCELIIQRDRLEAIITHLMGDKCPFRVSGGFVDWLEEVEDQLGITPYISPYLRPETPK